LCGQIPVTYHCFSATMHPMNPVELFRKAEQLAADGNDDEAREAFLRLTEFPDTGALAFFRLGEIENRKKNVGQSYAYHTKAFEREPGLAARFIDEQRSGYVYTYRYAKVDEIEVAQCPLCNVPGEMHSVYNMCTNSDFLEGFNPVRIWRICRQCNHIFAAGYPVNLQKVLSSTAPESHIAPRLQFLPELSDMLARLKGFAHGNRMLEVGVGAGELTSVAKEMLFDIAGVEIRKTYAQNVAARLGIPLFPVDFMDFTTEDLFDILMLGDVLEHTIKPLAILEKANRLLVDSGILWISTPNFESAFSFIMKDKDPMWRVCEHLNYFSYRSLMKALSLAGFEVIDYHSSKHYNGSMEVTARKKG